MSDEANPASEPTPSETATGDPVGSAPAEASATSNTAVLGETLDQIPASQIMETSFPTILMEKSVGDAYDVMVENKVDCLPILLEGKVVRIITKNNVEIMRSVFFDAPGLEERQARVMCLGLSHVNQNQKLISAKADMSLKAISQLMAKNAINSVPILNDNSEFQGMVTSLQILNLISG